jgi:hypothetical protein
LRKFVAWSEKQIGASSQGTAGEDQGGTLTDSDVVFIHQDYAVTRSIWRDKDVIYDNVDESWKTYCNEALGFRVPHDFDLVPQREPAAK